MESTDSERIVLHIPTDFTAEELAGMCRIKPGSSAFEMVEEMLPTINRYGAPRSIIKWASVDKIDGDLTTIEAACLV